jgi:hypothetical protein
MPNTVSLHTPRASRARTMRARRAAVGYTTLPAPPPATYTTTPTSGNMYKRRNDAT